MQRLMGAAGVPFRLARRLAGQSPAPSAEYFWALKNFNAPLFEGIRLHDDRHRQKLRELHERLIRLQMFMKPGAT